mgnify:CR=1 FL=1
MNVPGTWLRKPTIWRKLSLQTWAEPNDPTMYGVLEIDAARLQAWLAGKTEASGVRCTVTHAVTRAMAMLLRRHPEANVLVRGRRIWLRRDVDVFHQVAMPIPGSRMAADLSGAVVRQADTKKVPEIARELADMAEKVRLKTDGQMAQTRSLLMAMPGTLTRWVLKALRWLTYRWNLRMPMSPRDPFGGVMVTSVGMLGIRMAFAPIVTLSRTPMLVVVNAIEDRAVVRDGQVVARPILTLTCTADHRVIDGYQASVLIREMKPLLEAPENLDLEPGESVL